MLSGYCWIQRESKQTNLPNDIYPTPGGARLESELSDRGKGAERPHRWYLSLHVSLIQSILEISIGDIPPPTQHFVWVEQWARSWFRRHASIVRRSRILQASTDYSQWWPHQPNPLCTDKKNSVIFGLAASDIMWLTTQYSGGQRNGLRDASSKKAIIYRISLRKKVLFSNSFDSYSFLILTHSSHVIEFLVAVILFRHRSFGGDRTACVLRRSFFWRSDFWIHTYFDRDLVKAQTLCVGCIRFVLPYP